MNSNQNQKINQVKEETIVIGIDIASELHYARAFDWRGIELGKVFKFSNSEEGFCNLYEWIEDLKKGTRKSEVLVGAEPTGHYWLGLSESLKNNKVQLVFVNPLHVKRSKELDDNHPSKTDSKDPKTIAKLVIEGRFNEPNVPEGIYAELRIATFTKERIVKEINQIKNRVERWLKIYFPEYKDAFASFDGIGSLVVLENCPLPKDVLELGAEGVNKLWRDRKLKSSGMNKAVILYQAAKRSIGVTEGLEAARFELNMLIEDYRSKARQLELVMVKLQGLCDQIPEVQKVMEIKGIGLSTIANFIAEVGDIRRFDSPKQIQKLAGLAITESSSGKHKGKTSISKRGRKRLRCVLFQAAISLVSNNEEFRSVHEYYTTRKNNPLKKIQSITAISCKLIRVLYALLTKNKKYDPEKLVSDIKRPELIAVA
ncbi:IS110 family transposase [Alkalicella caledoniensis]|uniref:IS110 family transposase n=1 Tax=Alkalicella caledoniensis TaxID=2731377 RepID=A0A7G9WC39_ALKCA|nr:IS110 family transposase [Alkalicella caledoniensis]QNO16251.1 IS110 family transposase [Alkalicella caledoniensis]